MNDNSQQQEHPPRVSVTIPVYNCEPYIRQTLDSVLAQTYQDWECIIVDDASTDRTAEIVEEYVARDPRLRLHRIDAASKQPYPANRNIAIELSRGRWIAPLDGDDWWEPWKLERQVALAESEPGIVICCARGWIWHDGPTIETLPEYRRDQVEKWLPLECLTTHPAVLIDRQAMIELGLYDPMMKAAQDWDLWLKFLWRHGPEGFAFLKEPCMYYRRHDRNITNNVLKCSHYEWIIIRRTLRQYKWGLKNPIRTWQVLSHWLSRDVDSFRKARMYGIAFRRALAALALYPVSRWRWQQLARLLREWRAGGQPQPQA